MNKIKRKMRIGVIDSGIDISHQRMKQCKISGVSISKNGDFYYDNNFFDNLGHGTGIASIIHKMAPDAELVAIRVFHTILVCTEDIIIEAINWCCINNIDIINMSLGIFTKNPKKELYEVCKTAINKGIIIVAAGGDNPGSECYPAFFPEVFGVCSGNIKDRYQFGKLINEPIEFIARGNMQRIASINGNFTFADGSSYACAYFSGIVANQIKLETEKLSVIELKNKLLQLATPDVKLLKPNNQEKELPLIIQKDLDSIGRKLLNNSSKYAWIGKLALFPASEKEIKAIINFREICEFSITKFLDYPKTINIIDPGIEVQDWMLSDSELKEFDTLVVGYFYENPFQGNVNFGFELIKKAISANKNLYFFDATLKDIIQRQYISTDYTGYIYCPVVDWEMYEEIKSFRYQPMQTPVLSLIGTSSKQGKFTVQLKLKEILVKEGYNIAHISTEPQGELLGAVFSFPMGYNPTVQFPQGKWPPFLRSLNKAIEYHIRPDLILSGIQSWTIPTIITEESENTFRSLYYLIGLNPDAVICSINPNDPIKRIRQNVAALRLVSKAKVLLYAISPIETNYAINKGNILVSKQRTLSRKDLDERIIYYENHLNASVINILDTVNQSFILNSIINFFSYKV